MSALLSTVHSLPDDERVAVERALVPVARYALIGRLAGEAAHDAGNALFGLIGLADLLQEGEPLGAGRIGLLRGSAADVEAILVPLLRLAQPADDPSVTADLATAAERAVALARRGRLSPGSPLSVACPPALALQAVLPHGLAAPHEPELAVADGALRVAPAGEPSLDELVARRIALDCGGGLERDGDTQVLRLPPS